jgi:hypothetical protein
LLLRGALLRGPGGSLLRCPLLLGPRALLLLGLRVGDRHAAADDKLRKQKGDRGNKGGNASRA